MRLVWEPCTTSSRTPWWPSMSRRTFAGGKTPTGLACPPTGLTSRFLVFVFLHQSSSAQAYVMLHPSLYVYSRAVKHESLFFYFRDFQEWAPAKKAKKGKKDVGKKGYNRQEVSLFYRIDPKQVVMRGSVFWCSVVVLLIKRLSHLFLFLSLLLPPVWWSEEWESELCMIILDRRRMSCPLKQVNTTSSLLRIPRTWHGAALCV